MDYDRLILIFSAKESESVVSKLLIYDVVKDTQALVSKGAECGV